MEEMQLERKDLFLYVHGHFLFLYIIEHFVIYVFIFSFRKLCWLKNISILIAVLISNNRYKEVLFTDQVKNKQYEGWWVFNQHYL